MNGWRLDVEVLTGLIGACLFFVLGTGWGLFLNVTHMHRMRRWAESVCERLDIK